LQKNPVSGVELRAGSQKPGFYENTRYNTLICEKTRFLGSKRKFCLNFRVEVS
jgi:hypothetical protein